MMRLWRSALKHSDQWGPGRWGGIPAFAERFEHRMRAHLSSEERERMPGARFYFTGSKDVRQHNDRGVVTLLADLPRVPLQMPSDGGEDALRRFSQGIAQHVNDLLMAVLGQSALCRLDAPHCTQLAAALSKTEDLVQYGAHLTLHLLGLCGRGVFADPPYVFGTGDRRREGISGYASERFRSFPFYHLSAAISHRPLSQDVVHTVCRQFSREYLIVFDHLIAAIDAIPAVSAGHRAGSLRRLALRGRRLMVEIAAYAGGDPRRRRGKDVTMPDAAAMILRSVLRSIAADHPALKVTMSMGTALPPLQMLPGDFRHTLAAVVKNAAEAMPNGGSLVVTVTACTGVRSPGGGHPATALEIAVCDTGCGIPEDAGQRIFDPFYTLKKGVGLGLGLTGSLGRLQQVGGAMTMASAPGKGTVALIRIPGAARVRRPVRIVSGPQTACTQTPLCCG